MNPTRIKLLSIFALSVYSLHFLACKELSNSDLSAIVTQKDGKHFATGLVSAQSSRRSLNGQQNAFVIDDTIFTLIECSSNRASQAGLDLKSMEIASAVRQLYLVNNELHAFPQEGNRVPKSKTCNLVKTKSGKHLIMTLDDVVGHLTRVDRGVTANRLPPESHAVFLALRGSFLSNEPRTLSPLIHSLERAAAQKNQVFDKDFSTNFFKIDEKVNPCYAKKKVGRFSCVKTGQGISDYKPDDDKFFSNILEKLISSPKGFALGGAAPDVINSDSDKIVWMRPTAYEQHNGEVLPPVTRGWYKDEDKPREYFYEGHPIFKTKPDFVIRPVRHPDAPNEEFKYTLEADGVAAPMRIDDWNDIAEVYGPENFGDVASRAPGSLTNSPQAQVKLERAMQKLPPNKRPSPEMAERTFNVNNLFDGFKRNISPSDGTPIITSKNGTGIPPIGSFKNVLSPHYVGGKGGHINDYLMSEHWLGIHPGRRQTSEQRRIIWERENPTVEEEYPEDLLMKQIQ